MSVDEASLATALAAVAAAGACAARTAAANRAFRELRPGDVVRALRYLELSGGGKVYIDSVGEVTKNPGDEAGTIEVRINSILFDATPSDVEAHRPENPHSKMWGGSRPSSSLGAGGGGTATARPRGGFTQGRRRDGAATGPMRTATASPAAAAAPSSTSRSSWLCCFTGGPPTPPSHSQPRPASPSPPMPDRRGGAEGGGSSYNESDALAETAPVGSTPALVLDETPAAAAGAEDDGGDAASSDAASNATEVQMSVADLDRRSSGVRSVKSATAAAAAAAANAAAAGVAASPVVRSPSAPFTKSPAAGPAPTPAPAPHGISAGAGGGVMLSPGFDMPLRSLTTDADVMMPPSFARSVGSSGLVRPPSAAAPGPAHGRPAALSPTALSLGSRRSRGEAGPPSVPSPTSHPGAQKTPVLAPAFKQPPSRASAFVRSQSAGSPVSRVSSGAFAFASPVKSPTAAPLRAPSSPPPPPRSPLRQRSLSAPPSGPPPFPLQRAEAATAAELHEATRLYALLLRGRAAVSGDEVRRECRAADVMAELEALGVCSAAAAAATREADAAAFGAAAAAAPVHHDPTAITWSDVARAVVACRQQQQRRRPSPARRPPLPAETPGSGGRSSSVDVGLQTVAALLDEADELDVSAMSEPAARGAGATAMLRAISSPASPSPPVRRSPSASPSGVLLTATIYKRDGELLGLDVTDDMIVAGISSDGAAHRHQINERCLGMQLLAVNGIPVGTPEEAGCHTATPVVELAFGLAPASPRGATARPTAFAVRGRPRPSAAVQQPPVLGHNVTIRPREKEMYGVMGKHRVRWMQTGTDEHGWTENLRSDSPLQAPVGKDRRLLSVRTKNSAAVSRLYPQSVSRREMQRREREERQREAEQQRRARAAERRLARQQRDYETPLPTRAAVTSAGVDETVPVEGATRTQDVAATVPAAAALGAAPSGETVAVQLTATESRRTTNESSATTSTATSQGKGAAAAAAASSSKLAAMPSQSQASASGNERLGDTRNTVGVTTYASSLVIEEIVSAKGDEKEDAEEAAAAAAADGEAAGAAGDEVTEVSSESGLTGREAQQQQAKVAAEKEDRRRKTISQEALRAEKSGVDAADASQTHVENWLRGTTAQEGSD